MISKNKIKLINSLTQKKFRDESGLFIAEGTKLVTDLAPFFSCNSLIATKQWLDNNKITTSDNLIEASEDELKKVSNQKSPQGVLAVFRKPEYSWSLPQLTSQLSLALDDIQDPGNLGTILRIADWFGITDVFCSENTADPFGPKTVQATMGALARVRVHTIHLPSFLAECKDHLPIYGTFMDGTDIYQTNLSQNGIVVMGNEGNGISPLVESHVSHRLLFPNYPKGQPTSESLNVGVATALICGEFRRRVN